MRRPLRRDPASRSGRGAASQVRVVIEAMLRCCSPSAASAGEGIRTPPALHARPRSAGPALPNSSRDGHASGPNLEAFLPSACERPRPSPMPVPLDDDECHTSTAMESSAIVSHTMAMETTATTGAVISGRASVGPSSFLSTLAVACPARMDPSEAPGAFARLMSTAHMPSPSPSPEAASAQLVMIAPNGPRPAGSRRRLPAGRPGRAGSIQSSM